MFPIHPRSECEQRNPFCAWKGGRGHLALFFIPSFYTSFEQRVCFLQESKPWGLDKAFPRALSDRQSSVSCLDDL